MEVEEELETGGRSPFKESRLISDITVETNATICDQGFKDDSNTEGKGLTGLEYDQREDSGVFQEENSESTAKKSGLQSEDPETKGSVEFIAKMFSNLDDETLKGYPYCNEAQIGNHYTDNIVSHMQSNSVKFDDAEEKDLLLTKNISEADGVKSIPDNHPDDCVSGLKEGELFGSKQAEDLATLPLHHSVHDITEPLTSCHYDNDSGESRLSRFYGIQTSDAKLDDDLPAAMSPDDREVPEKDGESLACSFWADDVGVEVSRGHEEMQSLEIQHADDANELGLRNLCYSEEGEENKAKLETEKQLAAGELCTATKDKSPQRGISEEGSEAVSPGGGEVGSSKTSPDREDLELKAKELWNTLEEDERSEERRLEEDERGDEGAVRGEFDCHRFQQGDLHLWPAENDQWASSENRNPEAELRSEFFSGFGKKAWEKRDRTAARREMWEVDENDELAGSEPHSAHLYGAENIENNELQERPGQQEALEKQLLSAHRPSESSDIQEVRWAVEVQQEENIENLEDVEELEGEPKGDPILEFEVENREVPEKEFAPREQEQFTLLTETGCSDQAPVASLHKDSAENVENQNFNRWSQNHLTEPPFEEQGADLKNHNTDPPENRHLDTAVCSTEALPLNLEDTEPIIHIKAEWSDAIGRQEREHIIGIENAREDSRDVSLPSVPLTFPNDNCPLIQEEIGQSYPLVDNFSSVDFPSPPPSIDLDIQDDRLESLDDSFPSPPPSVVEMEEDMDAMNLDDFFNSSERHVYTPSSHPNATKPTLYESTPTATHSRGISANFDLSPVRPMLPSFPDDIQKETRLASTTVDGNEQNSLSQKPSTAVPSFPHRTLNSIPELLISEWKDLDEEALEDFEKLEQLCCISGDEEDALGDLFLGNLELLGSMKTKTPEKKTRDAGKGVKGEMTCEASRPEGTRRLELRGDVDGVSHSSEEASQDAVPSLLQNSQTDSKPATEEGKNGLQSPSSRSPCHSPESKDQSSLSKMPTKNGLMMQVCEERLQFSLSENVKTNVLWGTAVSDTVSLGPWGDKTTDGEDPLTGNDRVAPERMEDPPPASSPVSQTVSGGTANEPFTVIEQPEFTSPQPVGNLAMKAKLARLSLALPPLALALPLSPSPKGGFGDGLLGHRSGRRRGLSTGSDLDDEEEDEQEDESNRRVIVVTETDVDKRVGLRSLLKSPKEPMDREKDKGRNVSFFDDVTVYLFDQETPTSELSGSEPVSPSPASGKNTTFDLHGANSKGKNSKRKEELSIKPRSPVGSNPVTSSRFTVSPASDPHLK